MLKKLSLYYRTVKHLQLIQIRYRLWYMFRSKLRKLTDHSYQLSIPKEGNSIDLIESIQLTPSSYKPQKTFTFLNQSHTFKENINWNFKEFGKLWAYNLNYFDYLSQSNIKKEVGLKLIREFIDQIENNREGLEPYPISLRGINWIKFLNAYKIKDKEIDSSLYAQYQILMDNLEYHLLGNHLLENGYSLLFGAYYFHDKHLLNTAESILEEELDEQILSDGGHFERSPMYHMILFQRLLDCINLVENNTCFYNKSLQKKLWEKASFMLGWLHAISFRNNDIPLLNDSVSDIVPEIKALEEYAQDLNVKPKKVNLGESGYRKFQKGNYELVLDVGKIAVGYQPAHAHSDTFSFVLYYQDKPVIVDTGISTYEKNSRRQLERCTSAHNTVEYGHMEQSEMWSAFRVGRRAKPTIIEESENSIKASHDGYKKYGVIHSREWRFHSNEIVIIDSITGNATKESRAFFHINPAIKPLIKSKDVFQMDDITLSLLRCDSSEIVPWKYSEGFNKLRDGYKIEVTFEEELVSKIIFSD